MKLLPFRLLPALVALLLTAAPASAQNTVQSWTLRPGWNAIHLQLEPLDPDPSVVFAGVPIETVWTYASRLTAVEFIQNPNEPLWNRSAWLLHTPTNRVESFQNSLFKILGNRPYLINVTSTVPVNLTIVGRPALRKLEWVPDAYNLRGFPIDPAARPSFFNFLRASSAHYNAATTQLNKIYRLSPTGQWTLVSGTELIEPGVAYWTFTQGASDYQSPLGLTVEFGDGLDYGGSLTEQIVTLRNPTTAAKNVCVRDLLGDGAPLSYPNPDPVGGQRWLHLPSPHCLTVPAGGTVALRLALRRVDMAEMEYATILELKDGEGTRVLVPVTARKSIAPAVVGTPPPAPVLEARNRAGLWVGNVTLDAVAEVNSGMLVTNQFQEITRLNTSTNPTPTRSELSMRLLLHVDTNGVTRLLRDVIQLWKDGTYTNDANGRRLTATPGRFVLVTDDALIGDFSGAGLRDGQPVGRRLSSASYDWDGTNTFVTMTGSFAISNQLGCTLTLLPNTPTNPFRHKYHPDHDNLNATFNAYKEEAYPVTRQVALTLTPVDPTQFSNADYGYTVIGGTYRETILGLHKEALVTSGTFRLTRVATTAVLNQ